jgi:hypothetical protein
MNFYPQKANSMNTGKRRSFGKAASAHIHIAKRKINEGLKTAKGFKELEREILNV